MVRRARTAAGYAAAGLVLAIGAAMGAVVVATMGAATWMAGMGNGVAERRAKGRRR